MATWKKATAEGHTVYINCDLVAAVYKDRNRDFTVVRFAADDTIHISEEAMEFMGSQTFFSS
jgi:hypothetical protein